MAGAAAAGDRMSFRNLPPLHFLPGFEAAGRLGSFKAAAAELHVTPSALSQQIKALEDAVQTALFERRTRAVRLTARGATYLCEIQAALADIASASRRLYQHSAGRTLRLSTADFIAYEFILPRLSAFRARFPGLELSLEATSRVVDFATSDVDAAIRIADGPWPGLLSHAVGDTFVAPVCSPALARTLRTTAQLREQTLIEMRGQERRGWKPFMSKHGQREPLKLLTFDTYLETMRAAEQGLGVAFGLFPITIDWVRSGRLTVPLPVRLRFSGEISFVHRRTNARDPLFAELLAWLREQYAALPALPAGRVLGRRRARHPPQGRVMRA
jgi:LysR family glycine cleavage system transcriptional activator